MNIPSEYSVCDPDLNEGGGGLNEDVGVLRDFVRTVKSLENEHQICLTSFSPEEREAFMKVCEPLINYFCTD